MRIGIGDIQRTPDGYPIVSEMDPSVTYASCLPTMCGANPGDMATRYQCSSDGYPGVKSCAAPECAPYCPNAMVKPGVTLNALARHVPPVLTPENIVNPMPSITEALDPIVEKPSCSLWRELNGAIQSSPVLSAAILIGAFILLKGRR